jgi:cupin 2 domain-containing protein
METRGGNLFHGIGETLAHEQLGILLETRSFRLERIVSDGHATPTGEWFDQDRDEWVILLAGSARLIFEDERDPCEMLPGDYLLIPAHRRHRVERTDPKGKTVWLALHFEGA